jgi:hypothetical protein
VATANDERAISETILKHMNMFEVHAPDHQAARPIVTHRARRLRG